MLLPSSAAMSPVAARMQTLEWEVGLSLCALLGLGVGAGGRASSFLPEVAGCPVLMVACALVADC